MIHHTHNHHLFQLQTTRTLDPGATIALMESAQSGDHVQ